MSVQVNVIFMLGKKDEKLKRNSFNLSFTFKGDHTMFIKSWSFARISKRFNCLNWFIVKRFVDWTFSSFNKRAWVSPLVRLFYYVKKKY